MFEFVLSYSGWRHVQIAEPFQEEFPPGLAFLVLEGDVGEGALGHGGVSRFCRSHVQFETTLTGYVNLYR